MNMLKVKNRKGDKIFFRYDFGRTSGQRASTGINVQYISNYHEGI